MDSSAFLKLYLKEPDSERAERLLLSAGEWITGRHTLVEVRRNLARSLEGVELETARSQFARDIRNTAIVELTEEICEAAAQLAETTGARSLDSLHLGAAKAVGGGTLPLMTFDLRQAQVAKGLGWVVWGA